MTDHTRDSTDFMYQVAELAWEHGLSTSGILDALGLPRKEAKNHMAVKAALRRAVLGGVLSIKTPNTKAEERKKDLEELFNVNRSRKVKFHVAYDGPDDPPAEEAEAEAAGSETTGSTNPHERRSQSRLTRTFVHNKAAEVVSQIIQEQSERRHNENPEEPLVVCNAGGRAVNEMVKMLRRDPPLLDASETADREKRERLTFVGANNFYWPNQFERSANYCAVGLGEVFGAKHLALESAPNAAALRNHKDLVDRASLLMCGAGTVRGGERLRGMLVEMLVELFKDKQEDGVPIETVGDLAFNLIDAKGDPVPLSQEAIDFIHRLNPTVTLDVLRNMTDHSEKRVVVILDAKNPEDKLEMSLAVLNRGYATDVVLGTRLAGLMLDHCPEPS